MTKPEYIEHLELSDKKFFSHLVCHENIVINKISEKNMNLVWMQAELDSDKIQILDRIYKTNHPFYIYIRINRLNKTEGQVCFFYEPQQMNELIFFTKQFINTIKK